jgi:hypothetical protein
MALEGVGATGAEKLREVEPPKPQETAKPEEKPQSAETPAQEVVSETPKGDLQTQGDYRRLQTENAFNAAETNAAAPIEPAGKPKPPPPPAPNTKAYWQAEALKSAGIDPAKWDPSKGFAANDANVQKVYQYYTDLFANNQNLQWAGMAKLAGGTVYGGLLEISAVRAAAQAGKAVPGPLGPLANLADGELKFMENRLLTMQKAIFEDLGWQHEAFNKGGIKAMRDLNANGQLTANELKVWEDINSGDAARVKSGNEALLKREQQNVLEPYYDQIRSRGPLGAIGKGMSVALSLLAESPVPGGKAFRDVVKYDVYVDVPFVGDDKDIKVATVPGDITKFDDRWSWIKNDMLPKYQNMLATDPKGTKDFIVNTSLQDLAKMNLAKQGVSFLKFIYENSPILLPPGFIK